MPQVFDDENLRFHYPDGWVLERETTPEGRLSVTVLSDDQAFWTVTTYPPEEPARRLADTVLAAMNEEYPGLESDPIEGAMIAGQPSLGYDLNFWFHNLTNTACIRVASTLGAQFVVFWQTGDHELPRVEPVFRAMTESLLRESCGGRGELP